MSDNQRVEGGVSRRDALKRGLFVGGALWVVPAVQVVTMTEAHAETASGPVSRQPEEEPAPTGHGLLPKTGAELNPALVAAVGAGLVAAGSATVVAQRRRMAARALADGQVPASEEPPELPEPRGRHTRPEPSA